MKDEIVSFETAKLAREKGLVEGIIVYHTYCIGFGDYIAEDKGLWSSFKRDNIKGQYHLALAPTQSLLQRWLREVHKIFVFVEVSIHGTIDNPKILWINNFTSREGKYHETYEESLEHALQEALKLIPDIKVLKST